MAFGGYKFAGYKVDNSQIEYNDDRCLAIHIARVRAFLDASNLAGAPWGLDGKWLDGEISLNLSTGQCEHNVNDGCIHRHYSGYSTYFRYNGNNHGYYYILTAYYYTISDNFSNVVTLPTASVLNSDGCLGPGGASCFHCLSLDPFGEPEDDTYDENRDKLEMYLLNSCQRATKITSVGSNTLVNDAPQNIIYNGFVNDNSITSMFGYCIKDDSIISICCGSEYYSNSFSDPNGNNTHVNVMSLSGLSELYNKDDTYRFMQLDIKNNNSYNTDNNYNENLTEVVSDNSNCHLGNANQLLNEEGEQILSNYGESNFKLCIPLDIRTAHNYNEESTSIPYSGIPLCIKDTNETGHPFLNSLQYFKGCTNPELVAMNYSITSSIDNEMYSSAADGSLLYLYSYDMYNDNISVPVIQQGTTYNYLSEGKFNFYIGWDKSNPDIKEDASWEDYNTQYSRYLCEEIEKVYRTPLFELDGSKYYFKLITEELEYYDDYNIFNGGVSISAVSDGNYLNVTINSKLFNGYDNCDSYDITHHGYDLTWYGNYKGRIVVSLYNENGTTCDELPISNNTEIVPLYFESILPIISSSDNSDDNYLTTDYFNINFGGYYFKISNISMDNIDDLLHSYIRITNSDSQFIVELKLQNDIYYNSIYSYQSNEVPYTFNLNIKDDNNANLGDVKFDLYNDDGEAINYNVEFENVEPLYIEINKNNM